MRENEEIHPNDFIDELEGHWRAAIPNLDLRGTSIITRIVRMNYFVSRKVDATLDDFGLKIGEFNILAALMREPAEQLTPGDLQKLILVSSGGLSNQIDRLVDKKYVLRQVDPRDKRGVIVRLTPEGKALIQKAAPALLGVERSLIEGLSEVDQKQLVVLLRKLLLVQAEVS